MFVRWAVRTSNSGWNMESAVEDMDLSLSACLNGWKFK
jgi:hypothetical protein